jgi:hypothetical protein
MKRRFLISLLAGGVTLALAPAAASAVPVTASPTSLDFGIQTTGSPSGSRTVTITVPCNFSPAAGLCGFAGHFTPNPVFSGANPGDFSQTNTCGTGVDTGTGFGVSTKTCVFNISFAPGGAGPRTATLDTGQDTQTMGMPHLLVQLAGTGTAPITPAAGGVAGKSKKCKKGKKKGASAAKKKCKKKGGK